TGSCGSDTAPELPAQPRTMRTAPQTLSLCSSCHLPPSSLCPIPQATPPSLRNPHDFRIFLDFRFDLIAVRLLRRAREWEYPHAGKPFLDISHAESTIDFCMQLRDDGSGRAARGLEAIPVVHCEARHAGFRDRRQVREFVDPLRESNCERTNAAGF